MNAKFAVARIVFLLALKLPVGIIYEVLKIEWNMHLNRKAAIMGTNTADLLGREEERGPVHFQFHKYSI